MGGDAVLFREGGLGRDGVTWENNASSSRSNTQVPQPLSLQFDSSLLLSVFIGIQPPNVILSVVQTFDFNLEENRHNPTRKQAASRKRSRSAPETPLTLERSLVCCREQCTKEPWHRSGCGPTAERPAALKAECGSAVDCGCPGSSASLGCVHQLSRKFLVCPWAGQGWASLGLGSLVCKTLEVGRRVSREFCPKRFVWVPSRGGQRPGGPWRRGAAAVARGGWAEAAINSLLPTQVKTHVCAKDQEGRPPCSTPATRPA